MRSSRTKVEAGAAHDGVAVATAGGGGANSNGGGGHSSSSCASGIQVDPKAAVEATAAPVAVGVAAAKVVVIRPPTAVGAAGGGATGERSAPRRRAISGPGVLGAQILATRRVPAHQTRRSW